MTTEWAQATTPRPANRERIMKHGPWGSMKGQFCGNTGARMLSPGFFCGCGYGEPIVRDGQCWGCDWHHWPPMRKPKEDEEPEELSHEVFENFLRMIPGERDYDDEESSLEYYDDDDDDDEADSAGFVGE